VTEPLVSQHSLEYPGGYTRSVGPVIGRFLTGLRDGKLLGVRTPSGNVVVPPTEYDPETSEPAGGNDADWVEVGPAGTVVTWSWVRKVRPTKQPLAQPFAFALVQPDGADTAILAAVAASGPEAMSTGMRVVPHWSANRTGTLRDIEAWVPLPEGAAPLPAPARPVSDDDAPVTGVTQPIKLDYTVTAGASTMRYLNGLAQGKIMGGRAPSSDEVYAASRGTDPKTGEPTSIEVEVRDAGVVTTFCVVNIPGLSKLAPPVPFVSAHVLLDGANNTFFGLIRGCEVEDVRMGMRVKAKWADQLAADHNSILWWEPTGEPDAPFEHYKDYL
jgi:uncharacterized OB-fold protein